MSPSSSTSKSPRRILNLSFFSDDKTRPFFPWRSNRVYRIAGIVFRELYDLLFYLILDRSYFFQRSAFRSSRWHFNQLLLHLSDHRLRTRLLDRTFYRHDETYAMDPLH